MTGYEHISDQMLGLYIPLSQITSIVQFQAELITGIFSLIPQANIPKKQMCVLKPTTPPWSFLQIPSTRLVVPRAASLQASLPGFADTTSCMLFLLNCLIPRSIIHSYYLTTSKGSYAAWCPKSVIASQDLETLVGYMEPKFSLWFSVLLCEAAVNWEALHSPTPAPLGFVSQNVIWTKAPHLSVRPLETIDSLSNGLREDKVLTLSDLHKAPSAHTHCQLWEATSPSFCPRTRGTTCFSSSGFKKISLCSHGL